MFRHHIIPSGYDVCFCAYDRWRWYWWLYIINNKTTVMIIITDPMIEISMEYIDFNYDNICMHASNGYDDDNGCGVNDYHDRTTTATCMCCFQWNDICI